MSFLVPAEMKVQSLEKRYQFELQLCSSISYFNPDTGTNTYSTTLASATMQPAMSPCVYMENNNQYCHLVCRAEANIAREKYLQIGYWCRHTFTYVRSYLSLCNRLWAIVFKREEMINTSTSFVEWKSTSSWGTVSNFDTDSRTHYWNRGAAYENQQRYSWLEQYLRYSTWWVQQDYLYIPPQYW